MPIDRIENKRYEKNIGLYKWAGILALVIAIFKITSEPSILSGSAKTGDFIMSLLPVALFIQYRITAKKWGGQFMEWKEDQISFKSRKYNNTVIPLSELNSINITLDGIELVTQNGKYDINIEDYTEYEDRIRLKKNFEIIKKSINTSS